jgi:hypothetical protein
MFMNSVRLFLRGKLFRNPRRVLVQWLLGFGFTMAILLIVGYLASPRLGVVVASVCGGALQPWLFKDLKYA